MVIILLGVSLPDWAQDVDTVRIIPDGTQGEVFEVEPSGAKPKKQRWNLFPGKITSLKIGGGFLYEYAGYSQDANSERQMDSAGTALEPKFKVRDFRFVLSGKFKTKRDITWRAGFMYDGPADSWFVRETGLMIGVPELSGLIFIGRTKEGYSLSKVMNGYAGWALERQMGLDVIPILADGVKWLGYLPKQRVFMNVGIFTDWLSENQSFSTYAWQFVTRLGYLPVYSPETNTVLHVGTSIRLGETENGKIRLRSRPEANPAPYFIDTGDFLSERSNHVGLEAYYSSGPWMVGGEYNWHQFKSMSASDPRFHGGEMLVSYLITGESRPYNPATAIYGFVPVKKPVFEGGPGAWEALLRITNLDLNGGTVQGGSFWRITPMVNWYLSRNLRIELAYGYGVLDRFNLTGATHFFQSRVQFIVL